MRQAARLWRRFGVTGALLAAVLALALVLRLKGIAWGLPYSFLNVDESVVIPKGFAAARGHLNPQFFLYPSFFFYLIAAVYFVAAPVLWLLKQANPLAAGALVVDPGPYWLLARLVSAAFGVVGVWLVYRLGRAAFGRPAGLLAALFLAVVPLHVAYSHMAVTDVTAATLALLALLLVYDAAQGRGVRWLIAGAVAAGLATSTKYNMGMLVLPVTVAAVFVCREEAARRVAEGAGAAWAWVRLILWRAWGPMLLAFVTGSPFVLLDLIHFVGDFITQSRIMNRGWLGFENVGNGFWFNLSVNLKGSLGIALLVLGLAGLAWAVWRRSRFDLVVAPYVIVYLVYIGTWKELMDRYLLPVIPLLIIFAVRLCLEAARGRGRGDVVRRAAVGVVLAVAIVAPLGSSLDFVRGLSGVDVRVRAKAWVEREISAGSTVATENYGPPLVSVADLPHYRAAGQAPRAYNVLRLELPLPGVPNPSHSFAWLRRERVDYVIIASTVRDRVLAAAGHYPGIAAFYRRLGREAVRVAAFRPGPGERGPSLDIYRVPAPGPAATGGSAGASAP